MEPSLLQGALLQGFVSQPTSIVDIVDTATLLYGNFSANSQSNTVDAFGCHYQGHPSDRPQGSWRRKTENKEVSYAKGIAGI